MTSEFIIAMVVCGSVALYGVLFARMWGRSAIALIDTLRGDVLATRWDAFGWAYVLVALPAVLIALIALGPQLISPIVSPTGTAPVNSDVLLGMLIGAPILGVFIAGFAWLVAVRVVRR